MKICKLANICALIIILSGCSAYLSQTEKQEEPKVIKNEPVVLDITHKKKEEKKRNNYPDSLVCSISRSLLLLVKVNRNFYIMVALD